MKTKKEILIEVIKKYNPEFNEAEIEDPINEGVNTVIYEAMDNWHNQFENQEGEV